MRLTAVLLTLGFGGLQTLAYSDCCCPEIQLRPQPRKDKACGQCETPEPQSPSTGCCDETSSSSTPSDCFRLEPSMELIVETSAIESVPPTLEVVLRVAEAVPPPQVPRSKADFVPARPERGRPIYLLVESFLL